MDIGAVIVSFNSSATIVDSVLSVRKAGVDDVVVVDNASQDDSVRLAESLGVRVIKEDVNRGFAYACNRGARELKWAVILFINPDAVLLPESLRAAVSLFKSDLDIGVVGLSLVGPQGDPEPAGYGQCVTPLSLIFRHVAPVKKISKPLDVGWVSGGAMLVKSDAIGAAGGFDDSFFLYWEDVDLCRRLKALGWRVVFYPEAQAVHVRGVSVGDGKRRALFYDASADNYFRKHYATPICLMHYWLRWIYRWLRPLAR